MLFNGSASAPQTLGPQQSLDHLYSTCHCDTIGYKTNYVVGRGTLAKSNVGTVIMAKSSHARALLRRRFRLLGQQALDGVARVEEAKTGGGGGGGGGDTPGLPGSRERAVAGVHAGRGAPEGVLPRRRAQGHGLWTSPPPDCSFIRGVTPLIGGPHRARAAIFGRRLESGWCWVTRMVEGVEILL
jgi:hypothetical protein